MPGIFSKIGTPLKYPYMGAIFNGQNLKGQSINIVDGTGALTFAQHSIVMLVKGYNFANQSGVANRLFVKTSDQESFIFEAAGAPIIYSYPFSPTVGIWKTQTPTVDIRKVHQWAITYDNTSTSNNPIFYYDGLIIPSVVSTTPSGSPLANVGNIIIGNRSTDDRCFWGTYYYFMWFNGIITPSDVWNLYNERVDPRSISGLKVFLDFRQRHFLDLSGNGNKGIGATASANPNVFFGTV